MLFSAVIVNFTSLILGVNILIGVMKILTKK